MTKKKRRTKARQSSRPQRPVQERHERQLAASPSDRRQPARPYAVARDTAGRYQHVIPELKRIGVIAGAMILALIILSFVLV